MNITVFAKGDRKIYPHNAIPAYHADFDKPLNRGEKAWISRQVRKLGLGTKWQGNVLVVSGNYPMNAVSTINLLGFPTASDAAVVWVD